MIFGETLVHDRFSIAKHAFVTLSTNNMLGPDNIFEHEQNFVFGPTFEQKHCETFTECYTNAMKSLPSFLMCLVCVHKHLFVLYLACYKHVTGAFPAFKERV